MTYNNNPIDAYDFINSNMDI